MLCRAASQAGQIVNPFANRPTSLRHHGKSTSISGGGATQIPGFSRPAGGEPIWRLNPRKHGNLSSLSIRACYAVCCFGVLRGSGDRTLAGFQVGHWLAVGLIAINLLGGVTNVLLGTEPRAIVGVPITVAILAYLMSNKVREFFSPSQKKGNTHDV
jgi:hypothetical protein